MIIDEDFFDEETLLDTPNFTEAITEIELKNMLLDKITMINKAAEVVDCTEEIWDKDTVLSGEFQGTTECGALGASGEKVTKVVVKKRKGNSGEWQTIDEMDYDPSVDGWLEYKAKDKYIESFGEYEYCIVPVAESYEGAYNINKITTKFDKPALFDADNYYELTYDFKLGNLQKEAPNSVYQTLGGKYPTVVYNGDIDYLSGSVNCKIIVENEENYDELQTKKLRNEVLAFLLNKKPKILKTPDGFYLLINIVNLPTLTFYEKAKNIYDLTFSFVEVGDTNDYETMSKYGLIGVVERTVERFDS